MQHIEFHARGLREVCVPLPATNRLSRNTSNFIPHQGNAETENGYWALQPLGETTQNDIHGHDDKNDTNGYDDKLSKSVSREVLSILIVENCNTF